jgi:small subunit ribosomal protein S9
LIQDESPDQPTDETPTPDEENVEPATAPDETPGVPEGEPTEDPGAAPDETLSEASDDVPSAESPADVPAEADDISETGAGSETQPDQAEGEPEDAPAAEAPAEDAPVAEAPAEDAPAEDAPAADAPAEDAPAAASDEERRPPRREREPKSAEPEVIPGAHLEPDLVLDAPAADAAGDEYSQYASDDGDDDSSTDAAAPDSDTPAVRSPLELAADARYAATGKRKTAIARVILKPGSGVYKINGKGLEEYFPRPRLQTQARQPLDATGNLTRMDVDARIHGGGVSAQAGALRHGIARALVEAEPSLRTELKRRGYLTRDPREKERKKAGLKKARKRPQFSKR